MRPQATTILCCLLLAVQHETQAFAPPSRDAASLRRNEVAFASYRQSTSMWMSSRRTTTVDVVEETTSQLSKSEAPEQQQLQMPELSLDGSSSEDATPELIGDDTSSSEYQKGFAIISFITLLNASCAPIWHYVFEGNGPPPLFLNAVVSIVAFLGLIAGGPFLDGKVAKGENMAENNVEKWSAKSFRGGMELGLWKGLGTTCHIWGMALTTANHGAFILQMTTLIVPVIQGLRGAEQIPRSIQMAVALALMGIFAFTQDPAGVASASAAALDPQQVQIGDALVLGAAIFYSFYDIQTFYWGREVPRTELVTIKVGFQAILSVVLCAVVASGDVMDYFATGPNYQVLIPTVLWSGLIVNALATFLQVGGMQAVGPTRAQTIFASQPLWASIMNFFFLGEGMGLQGVFGGGSFLGALYLAANSKGPTTVPDDDDEDEQASDEATK